ncbi:MAG: hypothetical protein H0W29_18620 [Gemmatimonadales bacterium]|nr:hypothetical protein [Gemmatimonadales bacterium]
MPGSAGSPGAAGGGASAGGGGGSPGGGGGSRTAVVCSEYAVSPVDVTVIRTRICDPTSASPSR